MRYSPGLAGKMAVSIGKGGGWGPLAFTRNPNGKSMAQAARNLTDNVDGFLRDLQFLVVEIK